MKLPKLDPRRWKEYALVAFIVLLGLILLLAATDASAHKWDHSHTHDDYVDNDTNGCMCVTGGVSDSDLSKGMAMAMSSGGHELDYSTSLNQFSAVYTQQVDDDEEGAYSFKYGRRWDQLGKALLHVTWVPEQGNDLGNWVSVGGTIRW